MGLRSVAYGLYERRLAKTLDPATLPRHVGVIVDGNRRWARAAGAGTEVGHAAGADNMARLLEWCDEVGVEVVTLWLLSTDNLSRPDAELTSLMPIIEDLVSRVAATGRWHVHPVGALDLLPDSTSRLLKELDERTSGVQGRTVNAAIGYGGRREIADAVRSLMKEHAARGTSIEEPRRDPRRRPHQRAPLHPRPARPRPGDPHLRRAAPRRVPALAERAQRVLLLRGLLAGVPQGRLPPGAAQPTPPASAASAPDVTRRDRPVAPG
ncbi:hypothetical protein GCM10025868_13620 [Angustibacter aerolatus]|uniref:Isoprenyl transferase n=1 Tax=Angustibacter aerolatus TaxID=1162965 RepID=A0ABQ6JD45_9ACTN|nr:hypothetical protein GCM10025868_13620 [Angustibacter aerolatus]